jgi:hypothetical protein
LESDSVQFGFNLVETDIDLIDSIARERLICECVHIFDINHSKNNFASGHKIYSNKYGGNNSHVIRNCVQTVFFDNSHVYVYTGFSRALHKVYLSEYFLLGNCSNIVSILARNLKEGFRF